jgi:tryptophanyl-tRNA synthetase
MLSTLNKHPKCQLAHCLTSKKTSWPAARHSGSFNQIRLSSQDVIFSGIQPTGVPHLGNYLGALQQWVTLQNEATPATQLIFSIVDLHAITVYQDAERLRKRKRETLATLLAVGLNPERSTIFYQSDV